MITNCEQLSILFFRYFHGLVESFEAQMLTYRQQIEMLESHLDSVHEPNRLTSDGEYKNAIAATMDCSKLILYVCTTQLQL